MKKIVALLTMLALVTALLIGSATPLFAQPILEEGSTDITMSGFVTDIVPSVGFHINVEGTSYLVFSIHSPVKSLIVPGKALTISGKLLDETTVLAQRITSWKIDEFNEQDVADFDGTVLSFSSPLVLDVDATEYTVIIVDGTEVEGTVVVGEEAGVTGLQQDDTTVIALEVEGMEYSDAFYAENKTAIEGVITSYSPLVVDSEGIEYTVNLTHDTLIDGMLVVGATALVEGLPQGDTTIIAFEIFVELDGAYYETDEVEINGTVTGLNPLVIASEGTLYTIILSGAEINGEIIIGQEVAVSGFLNDSSTISASRIEGVDKDTLDQVEIVGTVTGLAPLTVDSEGTGYSVILYDADIDGAIGIDGVVEVRGYLLDGTTIWASQVNELYVDGAE